MNMKKILLTALFALSLLSSCRAQTVFTFECFCGYLTIADGNCDVCGPTLQSRMFTGIIIRRNGVPHKWIETPYTVRFNGQVARFQELVYPNPEIINIDRSQTPYGTLDSFKMAIQCPCVGGGGRDTIVIDSSGAVCAALYFFANDTAAIASPTTDQYDYYLTAPENYYGLPAGLVKLAWETTLPDSANAPGCGSGGSGTGTVTAFSFTDGGGFTGTVLNPTTTPTLSLVLQDAAADGATKGQATFTAADFNSAAGVISLDYANGQKANGSQPGFLSSTDWATFNGKLTANAPITGATKTKITYDANGLVTAGADATTSDIAEGSNLYYTDERNDDRTAALIQNNTGISWSYNDGAGTLTPTITDNSVTNEGALSVTAGLSNTSQIQSNTSGDAPIVIKAGTNVTLSESGDTITIAASGGGGGVTSDTYANWNAARLAGTLPLNSTILVSNRGDNGLLLQTGNNAAQVALSGQGGFLNADFQNAGTYSGVSAVTGVAAGTRKGIWYSGISVSLGEIVIYNLLHYQVTNAGAINGNPPPSNATAYTALPRSAANVGYILEWDAVEFDFVADAIVYRADKRGNTVRTAAAVTAFQWGNNKCEKNTVLGLIDQKNARGEIKNNVVYANAQINGNTMATDAKIYNNVLFPGGRIESNDLAATSQIYGNTAAGFIQANTLDVNSSIYSNDLKSSAAISFNTINVTGSISLNILGPSATISGNTFSGAAACGIFSNVVGANSTVTSCIMDSGSSISLNTIAENVLIQSFNLGASAQVYKNAFAADVQVYSNTLAASSQFTNNRFGQASFFYSNTLYVNFRYNTMEPQSEVYSLAQSGTALVSISGNTFSGQSAFWNCTFGDNSIFDGNKLGINADLSYLTLGDNASFQNNEWAAGTNFQQKTLAAGVAFSGSKMDGAFTDTETYSANISGKTATPVFSNFEATIDITKASNLDLTIYPYYGVFYLTSSNPTESLSAIIYAGEREFIVYPASGLSVDFNGAAASGASSSQIISPVTTATINGSNYDYAKFQLVSIASGIFKLTNYVNHL